MQNVVVRTEADAKRAIEYLHRNLAGRVTFLPLDALKIGRFSPVEERALNQAGFLKIASEAVECTAEVRPAVDFLLAKTAVVEDLDAAGRIMRSADYSFRTVTLKGDIIRPGGAITGGSAGKRRFGLLSRARQIKALQSAAKEKAAAAQRKAKELEAIASQIAASEAKVRAGIDALRKAEILCAELRQHLSHALSNKKATEELLQGLKHSAEELTEGKGGLLEKQNTLETQVAKINLELEETRKEQEALEACDKQDDERANEAAEAIAELRVTRAELSKEREAIRAEIGRLEQQDETATRLLEERQHRKKELSCAIAEAENKITEIDERLCAERNRLDQQKEALKRAEAERAEYRQILLEKRKYNSEYQLRQTNLLDHKYKLDAQLEKTKNALDASANKLWEDYGLTFTGAQALKSEISYTAASQQASEARQGIRELGTINPKALEDYERINERVKELTVQREDLIRADVDLRKMISELMATMRENFKEKFDLINQNFTKVFTELFGGGTAYLTLENGDVMECGIDIVAEPPGKRLQNISLLSGGERALTAIALLFAMLAINPSPVCLLDEIDSALDEMNVTRFGEYLKHVDTSQFLVITHRKPTMAVCNCLYGVSMEEKGVSRLVSVRMDRSAIA